MNRRSGIKNLPAALMALLLAAAVLAGCASPALPGQGHGAEQVYDAEGAQEPDLTDDEEILAEDPGQNRDGEIYPWMDSSLRQVMEYVDEPDAREDFAIYANREWSLSHEIPEGYSSYDMFTERQMEVDQEIIALLTDVEDGDAETLTKKDPALQHDLDLVRTYHELWLDWDGRSERSIRDLQELLAPLQAADSVDALTDFLAQPLTVISVEELASCYVASDLNDAEHYAVYIDPCQVLFGDSMYYRMMDYGDWKYEPYYSELGRFLLTKIGYTDSEAEQALDNCFSFEKDMAPYIMTTEENNAEDATARQNNPRTMLQLAEEAGAFPILEILSAHGFEKADSYIVTEPSWLRAMGRLYNRANLQRMKDYLLVTCLMDYADWLDRDCYEKKAEVLNGINGAEGMIDDATAASHAVDEFLPMQLGRVYTAAYVTDEMKEEVTEIVEMIRGEYRGILEEAPFLSDATKQEALRKLSSLQLRIAKPDVWEDDSGLQITPASEGGSLISAQEEMGTYILQSEQKKLGTEVDRRIWGASPQTVNAFYDPSDNSVTICAGILGGSFYHSGMELEDLLASVGDTVGHEISHAFDSSGRQFDEKGNFHDWWTEEDAEAFRARAQKLVDYYDGIYPFEGVSCSGTLVEAEAIADLVGFKCVLRIAAGQEDFDYKRFFESYAETWHSISTSETEYYLITQDSHPLAYLRINAVVQQFEPFYETYDVQPGDGMYLAPEDRLEVW